MASEFKILSKKIEKIDVFKIFKDITRENDVQRWVKKTIKNRIQSTGVDAQGKKMQTDSSSPGEAYADATIRVKGKRSGVAGIVDHVTLTDTGKFWDSFKILLLDDGFETKNNFLKQNGHIYKNFTQDYSNKKEFEDAVNGLSEQELKELTEKYYYPKFIKKLNALLS